MPPPKSETLAIRTAADVVAVRQLTRRYAEELGFRLVDLTKIVTAASEIARNTLDYGGGGTVRLEQLQEGGRQGLRLIFEDHGPGIPDIEQAMSDGYTSGAGMGMGLPGSKRLVNEFQITSVVGSGTRVSLTRWK